MKNLFIILVVFIFFSCGKKLQNKTLSSTLVTKDSTFVDSFEYQGSIEVTGIVTDEYGLPIPSANVFIKGTKIGTQTNIDGKYTLNTKNNDIVIFSFIGFENIELKIKSKVDNLKNDVRFLKLVNVRLINNARTLKPVIYLYPTKNEEISIRLDYKGKIETTFPNYELSWELTAFPDGKIFDKKTNRYYNSLFWDGISNFSKNHFNYKDGFIVYKKDLTSFFIDKLDLIGLSNSETNDFIQFWLPILEKNDINFIHFWINDDYNGISKSIINPKPDSEIRLFMDFYNLENPIDVKPQDLISVKREGFTYIEWGGTDVTKKIKSLKMF